jgi:hypothetical protein
MEGAVEIVVIDQFVVSPEAASEFAETSRTVQNVLKTPLSSNHTKSLTEGS